MTNGLDVQTRAAIQYGRMWQLDVRPWIYQAYDHEGKLLLELTPFRVEDNPYEDIPEGFYTVVVRRGRGGLRLMRDITALYIYILPYESYTTHRLQNKAVN
jgi:hypothetical protein